MTHIIFNLFLTMRAAHDNKSMITADEMLRMPDDGFRYHLIKGELQQKALSGGFHGIIAARFGGVLGQYVEAHDLGETVAAAGFQLEHNPDTVLVPDVAFVDNKRLPVGTFPDGFWNIAPNLVFEVVQAGEKAEAIQRRVVLYILGRCAIGSDSSPKTPYNGSV